MFKLSRCERRPAISSATSACHQHHVSSLFGPRWRESSPLKAFFRVKAKRLDPTKGPIDSCASPVALENKAQSIRNEFGTVSQTWTPHKRPEV